MGLRGAARGLGQALTFIGQQGMAEERAVAADQRLLNREMAFARFQQGIRTEDLENAVDRDIDKLKLETPHRVAAVDAELEARQPYAIDAERRAAERDAARDERTEARQDRARNRDVVHRYVNAEGHPVIVYGDGTERVLSGTERTPARDDPDTVIDRYTNDEGYRVLVTRGGQEIVSTQRVRETGGGSDDDDDLGADPASSVGAAIPQAARGAARRGRLSAPGTSSRPDQPPIPGARQARDGNWYTQRGGRWYRVDR